MLQSFLSKFRGQPKVGFVQAAATDGGEKREAKLTDPLDPISRERSPFPEDNVTLESMPLRTVSEFPTFDGLAGDALTAPIKVGDGALIAKGAAAMDDFTGNDAPIGMALKGGGAFLGVPPALGMWYMSQGFFGYQACAIIAQHWLVDKACSMSGEDAVRQGWVLSTHGGEDDLSKEDHDKLLKEDKRFKIKENLVEFNRLKNVFGIRLAIFKVKSDDPLYYEKPFNLDGCGRGCYEGISQVDPYWMTPVLSSAGTSDPSTIGFYEPQYWVINGKKYHISHLAIVRGPQPADILKPSYIFGGIPLTQRIYERVYAAERTANEAPLMAMSKRTMAIHADLDKVLANQCEFEERLALWIRYRDNHGIKVLGTEEAMEQFDTSMTDFDSIIMNQYQIVAAIARTPATKLLGTSPKGFNATGEFESKSYHEELESIQEHVMMPMLERHYELSARSLGLQVELEAVFNPVDSVNTKERADLNKLKADTGINLINAGVISPEEERQRIMDDEHSGYDRLEEGTQAETDPGMSPENLAALQKSGAAETAAENPEQGAASGLETDTEEPAASVSPETLQALLPLLLKGVSTGGEQADPAMAALLLIVAKMAGGKRAAPAARVPDAIRSVKPSTKGSVSRSVQKQLTTDAEIVRQMPVHKMPKIRLHGLNLVIENPRGTVRCGENLDGSEWASEMPDHYGYIKGYLGADDQDVDCFVGPNLRATDVYVIAQKCPETGEFDEYKCMMCYDTPESAMDAYSKSYGTVWEDYFDQMLPPMSVDEFKAWLDAGGGSASIPVLDDDFKETDHPRDKGGQFTSGGGGGGAAASSTPSSGEMVSAGSDRGKWPAHIQALKLPPAWTDVKVSNDPSSKLLAVGKDAKGRSQYVYSNEFKESQTDAKFERVREMDRQMGTMRSKVSEDQMSKNGPTKNNADAMRLVMEMGVRPGSDVDTKADQKAFGASNLEGRHVIEKDGQVHLEFVGKKGVNLSLPVDDPALAAMLKSRAKNPNGRLFPGVTDKSLLAYSHTLGSGDFKTKDFRTYKGTSHANELVNSMEAPKTQKDYVKAVKEVAKRVSAVLGNTPTVALQSYIDPTVFSKWKEAL